mgnify:CR=1 FL=1
MYLIIVYQGQRELARYSFADQRAQYNGALGVLKAHSGSAPGVYSDAAATTWEFKDANPKGRIP